MGDIVERLRQRVQTIATLRSPSQYVIDEVLHEFSIDEIERLRTELQQKEAEIEAGKMPVRYYDDGHLYAVYGSSSINYVEKLRTELKQWKEAKDPFSFEHTAFLAGVKAGLEAAARECEVGHYGSEDQDRAGAFWDAKTALESIDPATIKPKEQPDE